MPATPPTIVAPLPSDPRIFALAKASGLTTREAFAAAAECWAWVSVQSVDDIVVNAAPDSLDAVVDVDGFGQAMLKAGLVGTVDGGLVVPAELRRHQRDERGGRAAADADLGDAYGDEGQNRKRKEQNAAASRRYRKRNQVTGSKAKSSSEKAWRSLGRVAGHEVRAYDGQYGCYAMVLGATVGGQQFRKLTAGDKAWSLASVTLTDALPVLVAKWRDVHTKENGRLAPLPLVPSYVDFRDDAERLTALAKYQAAEADAARHADGADASSRHADASAASAGPSASENVDTGPKPMPEKALDASAASADRHADGASSSNPSKSSSSNEEEDMRVKKGSKAASDHGHDGIEAWDRKQQHRRVLALRFADALGEDVETILHRWKWNHHLLRLQLELAGVDPNTGDAINANSPGVPADARAANSVTTEPNEDAKPAQGNDGTRGEFDCSHRDLRQALRHLGISSPAVQALPDDCRELRDTCHNL